jgi:hypothetical protein
MSIPVLSDDSHSLTPRERQDLLRLARLREKHARSRVDSVAAERLAQFEQELATVFKAEDERWAKIVETVARLVAEADAELGRICEAEGIREHFRPHITKPYLTSRGENADAERRTELRHVAKSRVSADAKAAKVEIERASCGVQEKLIVTGLRSAEAKTLLDALPTVEALMPPLPTAEIIAIEQASGRRRHRYPRSILPPLLAEGGDDD